MEPFAGDREESTEDVAGRKHSKIKSLKTLFRRRKKTSEEANAKLSQSASDVTAGKGLGSDEELVSFKGTMGSRALSHDSIFLDDQDLTDAEPARVLSQENVHGKIKALQMKLQLQKLHFGPPPLVLPIKSPEELSSHIEDFSFHSSIDAPGEETLTKTSPQPCSPPISPLSKSAATKSPLPTPFSPFSVPTNSSTSAAERPLDFSSPAEFSTSLDTSAARHKLSIKPRNQRASTKKKPSSVTQPGSPLHIRKSTEQFEFVEEQKEQLVAQEEEAEGPEKEKVDESESLSLKSAQPPSVTFEAALKVSSQRKDETIASQILQVKPLRRVGTAPAKRPHSSFIESEKKGEEGGAEETKEEKANFSQHLSLKSAKLPSVTSEAALKVSSHETLASQMPQVKPLRRVGTAPAKRPHSSFIESEIKDKSDGGLEIQVMSDKKAEVSPEQLPMLSSVVASRPSFVQQQLHGEEDTTRGMKKSPPGSGSFPLSFSTVKNEEEERPRSGSFGELLEQIEAMSKTTRATEEKEKEEPKIMQLKGSSFAADRMKQEGSPSRGPAVLWDRKPSLKKAESARNVPQETAAVESEETESTPKGSAILWDRKASLKKATPAKNVPPVTATLEAEGVESSEELVDVAEEAKEEEGKRAFGVKLRSTSLSLKFRSEASSNRYSKLSDDHYGNKTRQETGDLTNRMPENVSTNTGGALQPKDPVPSGVALPVKHNTLLTDSPPTTSTKVQTTPSNNKEAETTPQQLQSSPPTSSSEVSWMSLAMEKTKSLQQLFTSRFPRDFTGLQTAARPQAQVQPKTQTETKTMTETMTGTQTQTEKVQQSSIQPSANTMKEELVQTVSQEQIVKPSAVAMQQKLILIESQSSKQPNEGQFQSNTAQPASQTAQNVPWTTQSPLRSHSQTATTFQPSQGSTPHPFAPSSSDQHQRSWSNRGFQPATQIKSSAQTSESPETPAPSSDSSLNKESPALFPRRTIWTGSVADRAAFLEKRAEWTAPPSLKGVEQRNPQTTMQTSGDTPISAKTSAVSKDVTAEIRQAVKSEESSPIKVPEKPREDKWLRKDVESPSSPSSLLTRPSVLQPDRRQPTWMELAKRKSMAWSDKTMD